MRHFADCIAKLCIDKYNGMKKTGKPGKNEWTVLAGIVLKNADNSLSLISLATGTKCLGGIELTKETNLYDIGDRLSDSHAEILARRGLLLYLYEQVDLLLSSKNSDIFIMNINKKIETKAGISFHFFCSQTPCGDCSIIPMNHDEAYTMNQPTKKRKIMAESSNNEKETTFLKQDTMSNDFHPKDVHRTGAKCLSTETQQDRRSSGIDYHVTGPLRTKPGRGFPTLSLSCSDKIAKWNFVGIQGSLLSFFLQKLRLETVVIGGECPFSYKAMERGLYKRFGEDITGPTILQASISFPYKKSSERSHPCPSSIVWCAIHNKNTEIIVEGRKQGATRNKKGSGLLISRRTFLRKFLETIDKHSFTKDILQHPKKIYYYHCKQACHLYQKEWKNLKTTTFSTWPEKPAKLQNFSL